MTIMPTPLIPATTSAVTSVVSISIGNNDVPATLQATNLAAAESVAILFSVDRGVSFEPLSQDGADLVLGPTTNTFTILSPMLLGVTKTATAAASGVFITTTNPKK